MVRPGVLSKTLSHMWGKLNLPIFLFNVALLTLTNMDSLMFLPKPCPSGPSRRYWWANNQGTTGTQLNTNEVKTKGHIVIHYTQGLCESIKKICGRYGIQTHFKGGNTIKNLLVSPKDKDPMVSKSGARYWFQCGYLTCDDEYMGKPPGLLEKGSKSTWRTLPPFIIIATIQTSPLVKITFK